MEIEGIAVQNYQNPVDDRRALAGVEMAHDERVFFPMPDSLMAFSNFVDFGFGRPVTSVTGQGLPVPKKIGAGFSHIR
jgi:hypothetical protein